jgi:hypothetical protein
VATDGWPGWSGVGADVARFAAAAHGIPHADADPRAVALTIAGRLTRAPVDAWLLTARLRRVHLLER